MSIVEANKTIEKLTEENEALKRVDDGMKEVSTGETEAQAILRRQANMRADEEMRRRVFPEQYATTSNSIAVSKVPQAMASVSGGEKSLQEIQRERWAKNHIEGYFKEQTRIIERDRRNAKSAYAMWPDKLAKELALLDKAEAKLVEERAEIGKPVGFDNKNTPVSNFYYLASKEYYIAMLSDGRVVCKQSGEFQYKRLVQNTLSTPDDLTLGVYSYPELTAEMFRAIVQGQPTYKQLNDVYKIVPVQERIVLEAAQATVIW